MLRFAPVLTALVVLLGFPGSARAQSTTLEGTLAAAWAADDAGLKVLRTSGATLGPVLVIERVPSGAYVAEVALELGATRVRYPLKLQRDAGRWQLTWQPTAAYAGALLAMVKSGALPAAVTDVRWADVPRLPALPVIATRARVVTPFGEVAATVDGEPGLRASPLLLRAAQRWIVEVLEDDPAPAGIDLLLDHATSWRDANAVLLSLASAGLYQVHIVTADMGVLRVSSPVARPANVVVALYHLNDVFGVRLSADGEEFPGDGCAPQMSACPRAAGGLAAVLERLEAPARSVMFAAAGDVNVGDALGFLVATQAYFGLPPHRLLVGYVQR